LRTTNPTPSNHAFVCTTQMQELERARMQAELHAKLRSFQKQGRKHQKYAPACAEDANGARGVGCD
jgi:hypothetical protein